MSGAANKHYLSDINYSIRYTRWLLRLLGIWPLVAEEPSLIEKKASKFVIIFVSVSMIILVVPIICHVLLQRADRVEALVLVGPITFQSANVIKHYFMIFRSGDMKNCIADIEAFWRRLGNSIDRQIMLKKVRFANTLTIACAILMYSNVLSYHLALPILSGNSIDHLNRTVRPLAFSGTEIFVNVQASGVYEIVFCSNIVSAIFHYTVSTAVCNLVAVLVSQACGQIQIIISKLHNLDDSNMANRDDCLDVAKEISIIIKSHIRMMKFTENLEKVLIELCFVEVIASTLIICFLEYYCITEWTNNARMGMSTYVILLVSFTFNLFLYCQSGEVLKEQWQEIGKAAYMVEWYRLPGKTSRAIIMIIIVSYYPRKLTAGRVLELSNASFVMIMKTSSMYFNMLRRVA